MSSGFALSARLSIRVATPAGMGSRSVCRGGTEGEALVNRMHANQRGGASPRIGKRSRSVDARMGSEKVCAASPYVPMIKAVVWVEAQRDHRSSATRATEAGPLFNASVHDVDHLAHRHVVLARIGGNPPHMQVVPNDADRFQ